MSYCQSTHPLSLIFLISNECLSSLRVELITCTQQTTKSNQNANSTHEQWRRSNANCWIIHLYSVNYSVFNSVAWFVDVVHSFPHLVPSVNTHLAEKRLSTDLCEWSEVTDGLLWEAERKSRLDSDDFFGPAHTHKQIHCTQRQKTLKLAYAPLGQI